MKRLKPIAILLGEKANQLYRELAAENNISARFFFQKLLIREARAEATALASEKLVARLKLIAEADDELMYMIGEPPKNAKLGYDYNISPKNLYTKVWTARRRMKNRGMSDEEIHETCLERYGMDINVKDNPKISPKKNPNWKGGARWRKQDEET